MEQEKMELEEKMVKKKKAQGRWMEELLEKRKVEVRLEKVQGKQLEEKKV